MDADKRMEILDRVSEFDDEVARAVIRNAGEAACIKHLISQLKEYIRIEEDLDLALFGIGAAAKARAIVEEFGG